MKKQKKAMVLALWSVLLWATVATAFKIALKEMDHFHLLLFSTAFSTISLLTIIIVRKKTPLLLKLKKEDLFYSALAGLIAPFLYYLVLFKSYSLLPAQIAQPLNYTWPIMLVILSVVFMNQKVDRKSLVALLLCMLGIILISTEGKIESGNNRFGIFLALFSALIWGFYWILNLNDKRDESVKHFLNFFFGLIYILIYGFFFKEIEIPTLKGIGATLYIGLFEMGITFFLWSKALSLAKSAASISTLAYLSPLLSLLFISLILGERIKLSTIGGLIIIILGILYQKGLLKYKSPSK